MAGKLFTLVLILGVVKQAFGQKNVTVWEGCQQETNFQGDMKKLGENPSQEAKCFFKCLMMKHGELRSDGTIDLVKVKETVEQCRKSTAEQKEKKFKASQECANEVIPNSDLCELAHKFMECRRRKMD